MDNDSSRPQARAIARTSRSRRPWPIRQDGLQSAIRTVVRSCGDVWIRQGLATGEREPRMLLRPRKSGSKTKYLATASRLSLSPLRR